MKTKLIVGISEYKIASSPDEVLQTYSLGSCLGLTLYDPKHCLGALIHCLLPDSSIAREEIQKPAMYVDTGLARLFNELKSRQSNPKDWILKAAGCGEPSDSLKDHFNIGNRNFIMLKKILWKEGLMLSGKCIGGNTPKSLFLDMETGETQVKILQTIEII